MSPHPRVFTMPSGTDFLPELATGLRARLGDRLADALILLPTRRAARALGQAFVDTSDRGATLLPRMSPLADLDVEDAPFEPGAVAAALDPAISGTQRLFELARVVSLYHKRTSDIPLTPANALSLVEPLCGFLEDAHEVGAPTGHAWDRLREISEMAAEHFQHAAVFYRIVRSYWPERLRELGLREPMDRRVAMLDAITELWTHTPPSHPVIVAGSTGTLGATARLIKCVSEMQDGLVVLPGLDVALREDAVWAGIDDNHPQNSLKNLLETMGLDRGQVGRWTQGARDPARDDRRRIISEALVPAEATQTWPDRIAKMQAAQDVDFARACEGLALVEARDDDEEALVIALAMREALETPGRTAALVTPDSVLARRVRTRLHRWGIRVDFSQGQPLAETALGAFLAGILRLAEDPTDPVGLAYVCKHPLCGLGEAEGRARDYWLASERKFRGTRPARDAVGALPHVVGLNLSLERLIGIERATADRWTRALVDVVESVARTDAATGAERLWSVEAGPVAVEMLEELIAHGDLMPPMGIADYGQLLARMMGERVVRRRFGTHPRLAILGPLEARMITADLMILGGLNETVWPAPPPAEPFLSRTMRAELGLASPDRRLGLQAHDFAQMAAFPNVLMTRSRRSEGAPTVASRWVWRMKTLLRGALGDGYVDHLEPASPLLAWARKLDAVAAQDVRPADPPTPTPPLEARWPKGRTLSITQVKTWVRDPYAIYANTVLGLSPLDPLDVALGPAEYGSAVHKGLETFLRAHGNEVPPNAETLIAGHIEDALIAAAFARESLAKERPRLTKAAAQLADWMRGRRDKGWSVCAVEEAGELHLPDLDFTLRGRADLIEHHADQGYAVIDFKTGGFPTAQEVAAGFDPQLPLTAAMLAAGGVADLGPEDSSQLIYASVKGHTEDKVETRIRIRGTKDDPDKARNAVQLRDEQLESLRKLIAKFDDPSTAYHSQPRSQYTNTYGDYDQLARRGEWAKAQEGKS